MNINAFNKSFETVIYQGRLCICCKYLNLLRRVIFILTAKYFIILPLVRNYTEFSISSKLICYLFVEW